MNLALENVSVVFGKSKALDDLSLSVALGERVAVIGSSGAGKSTLFRTLTRSVPISSGSVRLGDHSLYSLPQRRLTEMRRSIGTIRQAYDLVPQLSAGMNVALGEVGGLRGLRSLGMFLRGPDAKLTRRVEEALSMVGLSEKVGAKTSELSGGQQQRVAVARLLVQGPEIILADEPFSAVDPVTSRRVLGALLHLNEAGATLLVNLHDVELARGFPRVIALKNGRLAYDGAPENLNDARLRDIYAGDPKRVRGEMDKGQRLGLKTPVTGGMDGIAAH